MKIQKSYQSIESEGVLYLVGTPIGNLEDITYRAVRILQEAEIIAAEDTRQTRKLLTHFGISGRLVSYHEHNKRASGPELIRLMKEGAAIALVSDAGLPAISDPGADLVQMATEEGIPVVPIPGPNAALSALIASGMPTDTFTFLGFMPRDRKKLEERLKQWKHISSTLILYESPHRIMKTLEGIGEHWGNRQICLARELTKRHEEFVRGTVRECLDHLDEFPPIGEYCLIVEGNGDTDAEEEIWWKSLSIEEHVAHYLALHGNKKEAIKQTAADRKLPKREVYNHLLDS